MHKPTDLCWQYVKRLLRYLKQTVQHGLQFQQTFLSCLQAFFFMLIGRVVAMIVSPPVDIASSLVTI